jgi:hypothetical protein
MTEYPFETVNIFVLRTIGINVAPIQKWQQQR